MQVLFFTSVILLAWCCQAATQADQERCPLQEMATTTPPDAEGPFYVENSPVTADMGPANLLQDPAQRLLVKKGRVLHNHIRLEHQDGTELLITQMYFVGQGTGYISPGERILQLVELSVDANSTNGSRSAEFDMFVDVVVGNGVLLCDKEDGQVVEEQPKEEEDQPTKAPMTLQEPTSKSPTTTPQEPPEEDPRCVFFCLDLAQVILT